MPQHAAVLFSNDAFYAAFAGRNPEAMQAVWSGREAVTCIHPGWPPLLGRDAVMQSWRRILSNPTTPTVVCHNATARVFGETAYVVCHEQVGDSFLVATNVFVLEDRRWRLVHHQAGAAPAPEPEPSQAPAPSLQ